jgi:uncharacterized protein (TIGR02145 family)
MKQPKTIIITITAILGAFLAACGSDSGTGSDAVETSESKTVYGLGDCKGANEGVTKFVTSEDQYYKCMNGDWKRIESPEKSSTSEASSSSIQRTESSSSSTHRAESSSSSFSLSVDIVQGVMVDSRDGKEYLTVTIGEQTWMAENLDFDYQVDGVSYGSFYKESHTENGGAVGYIIDIYGGRRYTIGAAIDSAAIYSESGKGCGVMTNCLTMCDSEGDCSLGESVRGICPEGWHLPSNADWVALIEAVGGDSIAPLVLMSKEWGPEMADAVLVDAAYFHANPDECFHDNYGVVMREIGYSDGCDVSFWSATGFIFPAENIEDVAAALNESYDYLNKDDFYRFAIGSQREYDGTISHGMDLYFDEYRREDKLFVRCIKNK